MAQLNDQQRGEVEKAIFAGRKIEAIKLYRVATGVELVDAKRSVEDLEVDLRRSRPEMFINQPKSGCMGVLVCGALLGGVFVFLIVHFLHF